MSCFFTSLQFNYSLGNLIMEKLITNREKDFDFLRFLSLFGGCCSLKGFEYYHGYSIRHAKREISKYLNLDILKIINFSENEYLRSRGVGNIYYPKRSVSKIFNVERKLFSDPEKIIIKNLRFLAATYNLKENVIPISLYEKDKYFKIIQIENKDEFKKYLISSNMEDFITETSICICFPTIWSIQKCRNNINFWKNIITDFKLNLSIQVFSMSSSFNKKLQNIFSEDRYNLSFKEIKIDNFEKNYTNYLIQRNLKINQNKFDDEEYREEV